jgi:hypothetical protein
VTASEPNVGDQNGFGAATVILRPGLNPKLCWSIVVSGIDTPTAAHIHQANAGLNGPIRVALTPPEDGSGNPSGNPGTSSGCTLANSTIVAALPNDPSAFYINVHTGAFAGGAPRGQLH